MRKSHKRERASLSLSFIHLAPGILAKGVTSAAVRTSTDSLFDKLRRITARAEAVFRLSEAGERGDVLTAADELLCLVRRAAGSLS